MKTLAEFVSHYLGRDKGNESKSQSSTVSANLWGWFKEPLIEHTSHHKIESLELIEWRVWQ